SSTSYNWSMYESLSASRLTITTRAPDPSSRSRSIAAGAASYTTAAPSSFSASLRCPPRPGAWDSSATRTSWLIVLGTAQPQGFLHVAQQVGFLIRLAEIALHADFQRALAVLFAGARGDHDDRHEFQARIVLHVRGEFVAVHARHLDVEQHHV